MQEPEDLPTLIDMSIPSKTKLKSCKKKIGFRMYLETTNNAVHHTFIYYYVVKLVISQFRVAWHATQNT